MSIVVVGDLMVDVVVEALEPIAHASDAAARVTYSGGGAAANVSAWLGELGASVTLVARAGDDAVGRGAVEELGARGVDARVALDPALATGTCIVLVEPGGERTMLPDRGANRALTPDDLPAEVLAAGSHLHLSGYTLLADDSRAAGLAALERARTAGMTISVDPASAAPLRACPPARFLEWVGGIDLLLPNRDEAQALTGEGDPETAARALAAHAGEVVVTLGADGALWTDGAEVVRVAGSPAAVADTTGAGDAFAAGLLAARAAGAAPAEALAAAVRTGARAVALTGARPPR